MNRKIGTAMILTLLTLNFMIPLVQAQPHTITINFWTDQNMENRYYNEFMKVYFQNKTYVGAWDYEYECYGGNYTNGTAVISVNATKLFDLIITDGNLEFSETTGCPVMVENYQFWTTVQSDMLINTDKTLNYYINITVTGDQPREYFWGTLNWKQLISALWWLACFGVIIAIEYWIVKQGATPSWILPIIIFIIFAIVKLALGI